MGGCLIVGERALMSVCSVGGGGGGGGGHGGGAHLYLFCFHVGVFFLVFFYTKISLALNPPSLPSPLL
jgi:hypothetical protein